jgi:ribosomal subunit interface protein
MGEIAEPPADPANRQSTLRAREVCVEIVVTGRNVQVPDHFRVHVAEKLERLERYDHKIVGMEVELFHERNRRQLKNCQRVEITGRGCGPAARAEACAQDFYGALDAAIAKLESRLRRSHDRRRVTGKRTRVAVGRGVAATAVLDELPPIGVDDRVDDRVDDHDHVHEHDGDAGVDIPGPRGHGEELPDDEQVPGRIVRQKVHAASPMSVDDALSRMELVGHDFYLFSDADSGQPCVVYRRKGYDYGMIRLEQ